MLHFILNPISGGGKFSKHRQAFETLLKSRNIAFQFHETTGVRDGVNIARRLTQASAEDIIAIGGDGTLNEVLNGLDDPARVRLGLIPCGSGNDFAAAAGIPLDPVAALKIILDGEAKPTDYLECSGVRGINVIGTGIDVAILRRYARMKLLKGSAAYLAALVLTLFTYRPYQFDEVTESGSVHHNAFLAAAANGVSFGGGIPISPKSAIDDGLLDIVIVDDIKKPAIPGAFIELMQRRVLELKTTTYKRSPRLVVHSKPLMPIQIDGEIYDDLPFDVRLVHGKLRMYRP